MMQARQQNPARAARMAMMAAVAAMTMMAAVAQAAMPVKPSPTVPMRTLMQYTQGSWMAPMAVVLTSAQAWDEWNADCVAKGLMMGAEPAPAGVNWASEVVVVVSAGELAGPARLTLTDAVKQGLGLRLDVSVEMSGAGTGYSAPCHVVALSRNVATEVEVRCADMMVEGMPEKAAVYGSSSLLALSGADAQAGPTARSWGSLKADYR